MPIDDFFSTPTEPAHPRLRDWAKRLPPRNPAGSATMEVFRPSGEFGPEKPEMFIHFHEQGKETKLDQVPWEDDLNSGLVQLKVRSVNPEQEAERFALGLRAAMRRTEREFGDGFFNAVLVDLITESDLTRHREIADVMKYAYANKPHREGGSFDRYTICRELIADAIGGRAKELTRDLGYPQEEAKWIMVAALANFLDERFSVSSRREFGML